MGVLDEFLAGLETFEWDQGNADKNWRRHKVRQVEAEQALLNRPLVLQVDVKHSRGEPRFIALGRTDSERKLTIVFTVRGTRVRVISARPMSPRERRVHGQAQADPEAHS